MNNQYTYCPTCGARDDATERGLGYDHNALIAELVEALKVARDTMSKAEHELTTLNNLRATDLTEKAFNAHIGNGVERDKLEWMTDTTAMHNAVGDAWLAVDAAIEKAEGK